jgi:FkbM family methyltransferase
VDCGSNIGLSVLYFKITYPSSKIIAFEPDREAFALLLENVSDNRVGQVTCHNVALTNYTGNTYLYKDGVPGALGMTLVNSSKQFSEKVLANHLSGFINEIVDFLKLDIEGSEVDVLDDLIQSQKIRFIKQMIIEFHPSITGDHIQSYLDRLGDDFMISERSQAFPKSTDRLFLFISKSL